MVIDDEKSIRDIMQMTFEFEGYETVLCESAKAGLAALEDTRPDLILLDIKMPGMDGMEALDRIKEIDATIPVIILTGHGNIETAVEATKKGAYDFLSKPPDRDKILITIRNALEQTELRRQNEAMRKELEGADPIIGRSGAIQNVLETVQRVGPTEAYVLITGENGTGKELLAKAVHKYSKRAAKPMVEVNCAAIPNELIESELFGHEKGSFTGATTQRFGKFENADNGTLFLDEIGDMSLDAQAKVLRVLEEGTFERVGGSKKIRVDVRIIAATNKNLRDEIKEKNFREDLYHRLNVIPIQVPPLRERREDIPLLVDYFLKQVCVKNKLPAKEIDEEAVEVLKSYSWPGNIRELRNAVERLAIFVKERITKQDVETFIMGSGDEYGSIFNQEMKFQDFKDQAESIFIQKQLERYGWNVSKTAEMLDVQRSHLYTKMKKYGLERDS